MTTTIDIRQWKHEGRAQGARVMLVVWDEFPWPPEPYPVYVMPGENLAERFAAFDGNMQRVHAVYLLSRN
jgi:hypothetical protein